MAAQTGTPDIEGGPATCRKRNALANPATTNPKANRLFLLGQSLGGRPTPSRWRPSGSNVTNNTTLWMAFHPRRRLRRLSAPLPATNSPASGSPGPATGPLKLEPSPTTNEGTDYIGRIKAPPPLLNDSHVARRAIIPFANGENPVIRRRKAKEKFLQPTTPHVATFALPEYQKSLINFLKESRREEEL